MWRRWVARIFLRQQNQQKAVWPMTAHVSNTWRVSVAEPTPTPPTTHYQNRTGPNCDCVLGRSPACCSSKQEATKGYLYTYVEGLADN